MRSLFNNNYMYFEYHERTITFQLHYGLCQWFICFFFLFFNHRNFVHLRHCQNH